MILYSTDAEATEPDEGSAVLEVRNMILERVGETGLVDDKEIRSFVRRANSKVWEKALQRNTRPWETRTPDLTYDASLGKLSLDVVGGVDASEAGDLALTFGAAAVRLVCYIEVNYQDGWYPVFPRDGGERFRTEPGRPLSYARNGVPLFYYVEGQDLRFSPPPAGNLSVRATIVPELPEVQDAEHLLLGRFPSHHALVATEAARLCFMRDEKKATPWDAERNELLQDFLIAVTRGQVSRVRRTGSASPFNQ